jgi:hypothetical protein
VITNGENVIFYRNFVSRLSVYKQQNSLALVRSTQAYVVGGGEGLGIGGRVPIIQSEMSAGGPLATVRLL